MSRTRNLVHWIGGPVAAVVLGACLIPLRDQTVAGNLTLAFVALTIVMAQLGGRLAGLATAFGSALSLDFFLTRPYFHFAIESKYDVIAFLGLAGCGILASAVGGSDRRITTGQGDPADLEHAAFRLRRMRELAWTHLRWGLVFSTLIWVEALWHEMPAILVWPAVLGQGFFLTLAAGYAAVQEHWMRRGLETGAGPPLRVAKPWTDVEDLVSALWFALALASLVPWAYVAFGTRAPTDVLFGALACSATVLLLLALESVVVRAERTSATEPTVPRAPES
jgi:hypothetical protein